MLREILRSRQSWISLAMITVGIAFIAFCLLGALLSPSENTHNLPVALVNGDQGATAGPQAVNFGRDLSSRLTGPQSNDTLKWSVLDNRQSAIEGVRQRKYYAALVIPADYSASLVALTSQTAQHPAQIELVTNPVGPTLGSQLVQGAMQGIVGNLSKATGEQLTSQVAAAKIPLSLPAATFLSNPVQAASVSVATIGDHSGRGISVFFLAILLTLAGILSVYLPDLAIQRQVADRRKNDLPVSAWTVFEARLLFYSLAAVGSVIGLLSLAWLLNMDVSDWLSLSLFCTLYVLTTSWLVLLFQTVLGRIGLGLASLVLVLLSLPASGALFPSESIPALWQWLNVIVPMRYMVDGIRSVLFLNNEMENGFGTALIVLSSYALGSLILTSLTVWLTARHEPKTASHHEPLKPTLV